MHPEKKKQVGRTPLFVWLILSNILLLFFARQSLGSVQDSLFSPVEAPVTNLSSLNLELAPAAFHYDAIRRRITYLGIIDDQVKRTLVGVERDSPAASKEARESYLGAIDQMSFATNKKRPSVFLALLIFGGLSGALGVGLRSMVNFIGHACFRGDLDTFRWWPYYCLRPLTGFVLGLVLVAVVQAGLLPLHMADASSTVLWWGSLAFLAGFGEEEFTQRLRLISKTLFGEDDGSSRKRRPPSGSGQEGEASP